MKVADIKAFSNATFSVLARKEPSMEDYHRLYLLNLNRDLTEALQRVNEYVGSEYPTVAQIIEEALAKAGL